jgi:putative addiction module component (TIGR02574 family)
MAVTENIVEAALTLKPFEKIQLIDRLLSSLDEPDKEIEKLWVSEAEDRIDAYDQGRIKAVALEEVLEKYR